MREQGIKNSIIIGLGLLGGLMESIHIQDFSKCWVNCKHSICGSLEDDNVDGGDDDYDCYQVSLRLKNRYR